jgi:hypothetical protein
MNNGTNPKSVNSTAKVIMDLAAFIAMFLASILSFERLSYWHGHKKEMKVKLRSALKEVFVEVGDEFADMRSDWESYYKKAFHWTVDFSEVIIPSKPEGEWLLIFIAKGLTCDKVYMVWNFLKWKYTGSGSIDAAVLANIRTPTEHYAVWVRVGVEPDAEFLGKSTKEVDADMNIGMTLLERMLFEGKYFNETGKHLDIVGCTFCSGSRVADGNVPYVSLGSDGSVRVYWCSIGSAGARYGVRRAVSA